MVRCQLHRCQGSVEQQGIVGMLAASLSAHPLSCLMCCQSRCLRVYASGNIFYKKNRKHRLYRILLSGSYWVACWPAGALNAGW